MQQGTVAIVSTARQRGDDRGASRHVDPRCQGLGRKHHLQQALLEAALHQGLPGW